MVGHWNGLPLPRLLFITLPFSPIVQERDAFWAMKQRGEKLTSGEYKPIRVVRNTSAAMIIATFALSFGFAMIWHIWWLAVIGILGLITTIIVRTTSPNNERIVSVAEIEKTEADLAARRQYA